VKVLLHNRDVASSREFETFGKAMNDLAFSVAGRSVRREEVLLAWQQGEPGLLRVWQAY